MPRRKSKRGGVALGFILTVGVLSIFTLVLLESSNTGVTVAQIPDKLPTYPGVLQRFVPTDALQVSFDNLTAIRTINSSVISRQQFFELDQPRFSMNTTAVGWRLTVGLSKPNATVTVAAMDQVTYSGLSTTLKAAGDSVPTDRLGEITLYAAAGTISQETQAYWFALLPGDHALVFSPGANDALQAVKHILGVQLGSVTSIVNRTDVERMLYTVNGTQGHLALGIQNFPGSVRTANATLIAVDAGQGSAYVSYVVRFVDATEASSQIPAVKSAYISAHQFLIYSELVKAIEVQPLSQLRVAVGLVG